VDSAVRFEAAFADLALFHRGNGRGAELAVTASNRAGMVYRLPGCPETPRQLAERLDGESHVVLFREDGSVVARKDGDELRFSPSADGWQTSGASDMLGQPDALERCWAALANPNAGDLVVSAAPGVEFADLGGRHHVGGGSHGSLEAGDSEVPMLSIGAGAPPARIVDVTPRVLDQFGVHHER
jgi:hypothetical protein